MAKKSPKRGRGRPAATDPLGVRMMVRINAETRDALDAFARRSGAGEQSTAARIIIVERLRADGFLNGHDKRGSK